jgi:hypothetical protein
MNEHLDAFRGIAIGCLFPLPIASWLLKRRIQAHPPELAPGGLKSLKIGISLGFISCASVVILFFVSLMWDPAPAKSVEAPNTVLTLVALAGNLRNLVAIFLCLTKWSKPGFLAVLILAANQIMWLFLGGLILIAHGF